MVPTNGGKACVASTADSGSIESLRFYHARRTVIEMLWDRGYLVADMEAELRRSFADFRSEFGDKPEVIRVRLFASRASNPYRKILVIFSEAIDIKKQNAVGILSQIVNKETLDRVILILQKKINSHARKVFDEYPVKVETFLISDLLVNITKHYLMPKFKFLSPVEKEKLLKKYSIEDNQVPKMLESDATARYYGLIKGDVVKVTYSGRVTEAVGTYRCLV